MKKRFSFGLFLLLIVGLAVIVGAQETAAPGAEEEGMTFLGLMIAGGPVMIPLFLCSVVVIALGFYFTFSLRKKKIFFAPFIEHVKSAINKGDLDQALTSCKKSQREVASIFRSGLEVSDQPIEKVREKMEYEGSVILGGIRKNIEYLNIIGITAPMLGLLGTVAGMISCFNTIAFKAGLGNPKLLAGGISQALITTATGLPIGIAAFFLYIYFREKMGHITTLMGGLGEDIIGLIEAAKNKKG